ncbi:MAG: hypothetical protein M1820_003225 [Bogoriella megaspora]|nr:MAG: hypothetical protein M1820_003225 [Bogoriella megaspora]
MNQYGFRTQVLSMDPNPSPLLNASQAQEMNDQLAAAIKPYPDRFRGFCFPPMADPEAAAAEFERCKNELGFLGALVDCHLGNMTFYGNTVYDSFWKTAEDLQMPIYLRPTYPPGSDVTSAGGRDNGSSLIISGVMSSLGYQWHVDAWLSFLHLWTEGVFECFPNVKVVLGHGAFKQYGVTAYEAWDANVWVTTSGFFSLDPFKMLLTTTKTERIMFSVD